MLLEDLDRQVGIQIQAALMARMSGSEAEVPDLHEARQRLVSLLRAAPANAAPSSRTQVLREAFGLTATAAARPRGTVDTLRGAMPDAEAR